MKRRNFLLGMMVAPFVAKAVVDDIDLDQVESVNKISNGANKLISLDEATNRSLKIFEDIVEHDNLRVRESIGFSNGILREGDIVTIEGVDGAFKIK